MVTQEALCCGTPALVTRDAGIAERYPAALRDLLIDNPEDDGEVERRLRMFSNDMERYRATTREFSQTLRENTWDAMARQMCATVIRPNTVPVVIRYAFIEIFA